MIYYYIVLYWYCSLHCSCLDRLTISSIITPVFQENSLIIVVYYPNQNYEENNQHKYVLSNTITDPNHKRGLNPTQKSKGLCVPVLCSHRVFHSRRVEITDIIWRTLTHNSIHDISVQSIRPFSVQKPFLLQHISHIEIVRFEWARSFCQSSWFILLISEVWTPLPNQH